MHPTVQLAASPGLAVMARPVGTIGRAVEYAQSPRVTQLPATQESP